MSSLQILLFGAPRVTHGNIAKAKTIPVRRRKSLALLAYLVTEQKAQSRDALAALLWPESDQAGARANLRRDLSRLQQDIGVDIVRAERDLIALKEDEVTCDVVTFRRLLAAVAEHDHVQERQDGIGGLCARCVRWLEEAVALVEGDFMAGFSLPDSAPFEEWQLFQAERLHRAYGRALQQLQEWHVGHGQYDEALTVAMRWLALDALHEGAQRQVMRLYAWSGQTAAALRQYQECARLLQTELGVQPAPETTALYDAIRTQTLPGPPAVVHTDDTADDVRRIAASPVGQPATPTNLSIPFVGRQSERAQLIAAIDRASTAKGQTILLEGEPGIGKSRLVQEAAQQALQRGMDVLFGKCYQGEETMPYQVVMVLLDQILANWPASTLAQLSPAALAELALLAPEIAARFPDLPQLPRGLEEARQARLFRSISQLLALQARDRGLMVVVDDLQWADPVTRLFVTHVAHQAPQEALLLVLTYRSEATATDEDLAAQIQSLMNQPGVQHLALSRLSSRDAEELVHQLPAELSEAHLLGQWLHRETEGNPFFLVSILQSLQEKGLLTEEGAGGWRLEATSLLHDDARLALPDALREAVRARLVRVPRAVRAVMDVAAVYGRSFDFDTLQSISGESTSALLDLLESLLRRQLLVEDEDGGQYDFSHDKVREVVYQDLSSARRRLLHRVIGETLEERGIESPAILAGHYEAAQVWEKAIAHLCEAAAHARELFAIREASNFYDRALDAAQQDSCASDDRQLLALYEQRGETRALAGDFEGAVTDLQQALQMARARGDRDREGILLTKLGMTYRRADDYTRARETLGRALELARSAGDAHRIADNLFHLGTVIWTEGDNARSAPYQEEAVAICRREGIGDLAAVQAMHGRAENFFLSGEYEQAVTYLSESLALARQIGDRAYEAENLYMLGGAHSGLIGAHYAKAREALEASLRISRAAQMDWHILPPLFILCDVMGSLGQYGVGLQYGLEAVQLAERLEIIYFKSIALDFLGNLYRDLNLLQEAEAALAQGAEEASQGHAGNWLPRIEADLAIVRLRRGDRSVGEALKSALQTCLARRQELHGARCLAGLAEWALAIDDAGQALSYARQLRELAEPRGMREALAHAWQWQGLALTALGRIEEADESLRQALSLAQTLGAPCVLRRAHAALRAFYERQERPIQAEMHAQALASIVTQMAESLPDPALRQRLLETSPD